jgi:chromosome segregation ATPase
MRSRSHMEELTARVARQARRLERQAKALRALEDKVTMLEDELNDARAQGRRTGELADVVVSILVHESAHMDPELRRLVGELVHEF